MMQFSFSKVWSRHAFSYHSLRFLPALTLGLLSACHNGAGWPQNPPATLPVTAAGGIRVLQLSEGLAPTAANAPRVRILTPQNGIEVPPGSRIPVEVEFEAGGEAALASLELQSNQALAGNPPLIQRWPEQQRIKRAHLLFQFSPQPGPQEIQIVARDRLGRVLSSSNRLTLTVPSDQTQISLLNLPRQLQVFKGDVVPFEVAVAVPANQKLGSLSLESSQGPIKEGGQAIEMRWNERQQTLRRGQFLLKWNTRELQGNQTVSVVARDPQGNRLSQSEAVLVSLLSGTPSRAVTLLKPTGNLQLNPGDKIALEVAVQNTLSPAIRSLEFWDNNNLLLSDGRPLRLFLDPRLSLKQGRFSLLWDSQNGSFSDKLIKAVAKDAQGNVVSESTSVSVRFNLLPVISGGGGGGGGGANTAPPAQTTPSSGTPFSAGFGSLFNIAWSTAPLFGGSIKTVAAASASTAYAGLTTGGLYRTVDSGANWQRLQAGLPNRYQVHKVAVSPHNAAEVWLSLQDEDFNQHGLYRSLDGGNTWTSAQTGINTAQPIVSIAFDSLVSHTIFVGRQGTPKVYWTTNNGASWADKTGSLPSTANIHEIAIDPLTPAHLLLATSEGLFRSTDLGNTWNQVTNGIGSGQFVSVAFHPSNPSRVYLAELGGTEVVHQSNDGAVSFSSANGSLTSTTIPRSLTLNANGSLLYLGSDSGLFSTALSPINWTTASISSPDILSLAASPTAGILYAGSQWGQVGAGVYRYGGTAWSQLNNGLQGLQVNVVIRDTTVFSRLYAGTENQGVFRSQDGGLSWSSMNDAGLGNNISVKSLALDPSNNTLLYAGTQNGVYQATNATGAYTWSNTGLTSGTVQALAVDTAGKIYAGLGSGNLQKSSNGGTTFTALSPGLSGDITAIAIDPNNPDLVYVAANSNGLVKTNDGGTTWLTLNNAPLESSNTLYSLALDSTGKIYAGGENVGVLISSDGGNTWTSANTGLPNGLTVRSLSLNPLNQQMLFVGLGDQGFYGSANGGQSWANFNAGLPSLECLHVLAFPISTTQFKPYVSLKSRGLWKSNAALNAN